MGYDVNRTIENVDTELLCHICKGLLEDPRELPECEHLFCINCIKEHFSKIQSCPIDYRTVDVTIILPAPRFVRNLLSRLNLKCKNLEYGCTEIIPYEQVKHHEKSCNYDPQVVIECKAGCGAYIKREELRNHNCVGDIKDILNDYKKNNDELELQLRKQRDQIQQFIKDIKSIKLFLQSITMQDSSIQAILTEIERRQIVDWAKNFSVAHIDSWDSLIPTPNPVIRNMLRRTLMESECPNNVTEKLMINCDEWHWPYGINSSDIRAKNRGVYFHLICRRIPGKQAVVVLECDNPHMNQEMMKVPGYIIVFESGISVLHN